MAAFLLRRGAGLCFRCVHRELCRVLWRPQSALFSSKPTDRKQPRRTHIKKAKPQPMVDVAKLLEQLFSQRRPDAASRVAKAQATKTSSMPTRTSATSSLKSSTQRVPPLLKTQPAVSTFTVHKNTSSTLNSASPANLKTSFSQEMPQQSLESPLDFAHKVPLSSVAAASLRSDASTAERLSLAETNTETATVEHLSAQVVEKSTETATLEPVIEILTESPVEPSLSAVETQQVAATVSENAAIHTIEVSVEEVQTKSSDFGEVSISVPTKEPLIETTVDLAVEPSLSAVETQEVLAVVGDLPNHIIPTLAEEVQTGSGDSGEVTVSVTTKEEPAIETAIDPPVEAAETLVIKHAVVEGPAEPPAEAAQVTSTDSGSNSLSLVEEEPSIETTINTSVETIIETKPAEGSVDTKIETEAAQAATTHSIDLGVVDSSNACKVEPLIEYGKTVEPPVEASTSSLGCQAAVPEGAVKPIAEDEAAGSLSHTALNVNESAPSPVETETDAAIESPVESSAVEEAVKDAEQMTLESVTLHAVQVQVESLQADELLQTKSALDEKVAEHLEQSSSSDDCKAAAESENLTEEESEVLTQSLSKWDTLSEDLQQLEGESDALVNELLSAAPAVVNSTAGSDLPAGAVEEAGHVVEDGGEAVSMTLESVTLAEVKAGVGSLETEVLLDARKALEKEAEAVATKENVEVETAEEDVNLFEQTIEAEILTLDTISETTDAIEAETSVMLEAMFGSEQGSSQPSEPVPEDLKLGLEEDQAQDPTTDREAQIEAAEQEGSVLEAMTLESVTLAEVEASLGTLETKFLGETTGYLEKEAELLAGEKSTEVEDEVVSEETAEALKIESLSLPEAEELSEALQTEALMEELFFSVPGHLPGVTQSQTAPETVSDGSVDVSPVLDEAPLEQEAKEEEAQTEALGTVTDLDPVQRLFLEKIREYTNMRKLNEGLLEAEPEYKKYLSEETAKLQRLYGGGDLSSFPEFSFTEPEMDQDSK